MKNNDVNRHRCKLILFGALVLAVMVFIFVLSAEDGNESSELSNSFLTTLIGRIINRLTPESWGLSPKLVIRKCAHMFEYFCLAISAFLFLHELMIGRVRRCLTSAGLALCWSFLYACSDEWHQSFVPGRSGQFTDVLIDSCGALIGLLASLFVAGLIIRRRRLRQERE